MQVEGGDAWHTEVIKLYYAVLSPYANQNSLADAWFALLEDDGQRHRLSAEIFHDGKSCDHVICAAVTVALSRYSGRDSSCSATFLHAAGVACYLPALCVQRQSDGHIA